MIEANNKLQEQLREALVNLATISPGGQVNGELAAEVARLKQESTCPRATRSTTRRFWPASRRALP